MDIFIKKVDLRCETNNNNHHTDEITTDQLIVRRGQAFTITLHMLQPFNPKKDKLLFTASTGESPEENRGTQSLFGIPDSVAMRSMLAKAVWKVDFNGGTPRQTTKLELDVMPPADAPIGKYSLSLKMGGKEGPLGELYVLFNPWCPADWVYMCDDKKRQEYVMNQQGIVYKGSRFFIFGAPWDFGQFEEEILDICLRLLDLNRKHKKDPADDVSARCNPIYVSRVISAMINCQDDHGVLVGCWDGDYCDGQRPTHWTSSTDILKQWQKENASVKYGQCWVFAAVMCSVMRCLGIPCRVVTNFASAHDTDRNLTIDVYRNEEGDELGISCDSIWNFHVWTEGWMTRPDLTDDGKYDGWQVLDPTPQELSGGVYCCGPASVKAILHGETATKYDVPFVFAEVNADRVEWLLKADGSKVELRRNSTKVGKGISTKCVGCDKRHDLTNTYKHEEGSEKERAAFKHASTRDYCRDGYNDSDGEEELGEPDEEEEEEVPVEETKKEICLQYEEVCKPLNGQDVDLKLQLHSKDSVPRPLTIKINVQTMKYTGTPVETILKHVMDQTLEPGKDLSIPVQIPFSVYGKPMMECDSMNVLATVIDKDDPEKIYVQDSVISLEDPPLYITFSRELQQYHEVAMDVLFKNTTTDTLTNCNLTICGSGLLRDSVITKLPDLKPKRQVRCKVYFSPYKIGKKKVMADFDCSMLRDIKGSCEVDVLPYDTDCTQH